jgi:type II secretory ATPase GspE/PulE/Tfp pilus assembly ATPase PilB-like protein
MPEVFELKETPCASKSENDKTEFPLRAKGCDACNGSGISGRELLFEFIAPVKNEAGKRELVSSPTLKQSSIELVKKGVINASEALALL